MIQTNKEILESETSREVSLKGTWVQALATFFSPLLLFLILRWALIEPFVIPSESMLPNLLIHDHIFVFKSVYGLKIPFSDRYLFKWGEPERGDVVVFKYPLNPQVYYIKRLIGKPGDKIEVRHGQITVNGDSAKYDSILEPGVRTNDENLYLETLLEKKRVIKLENFQVQSHSREDQESVSSIEVPEDKFFVMGDNRDNSSDSRVWGFVPRENFVGKAWFIWLSCEQTMVDMEFLCDPLKMRWNRFLKKVDVYEN